MDQTRTPSMTLILQGTKTDANEEVDDEDVTNYAPAIDAST